MKRDRCWLVALAAVLSLAAAPTRAEAATPAASATARGAVIYERCAACHALSFDRTGPRHCGLFGRRAGSLAGFEYSPALRRSQLVWNDATLDRFLKNPMGTIPGTAMGYDGIKDAGERRDLIAYLRAAGDSPECRAAPP
ncbi:MAG TPA: c-type cytochrome [Rhodocyclaceae bacterium]|nr:c-type cytochrome [Rhodocyclaceae bacterium]